jgi:hypothetical protein
MNFLIRFNIELYFRSQTVTQTLDQHNSRLKLVENVIDTLRPVLDQIKVDTVTIKNGLSMIPTIRDDIREVKAKQIMDSTKIENLTWIVYIYFAINIIMLAYNGYFK